MPWNSSSGMSAHDWDLKERNRVAVWEKKIANPRNAEWKKNMQRHSIPPPFGSTPFIPPTPLAWTQQFQPSFAPLFPPINPYRPSYKPASLANITNIHRAHPESSPPQNKSAVAVSNVSAIYEFIWTLHLLPASAVKSRLPLMMMKSSLLLLMKSSLLLLMKSSLLLLMNQVCCRRFQVSSSP